MDYNETGEELDEELAAAVRRINALFEGYEPGWGALRTAEEVEESRDMLRTAGSVEAYRRWKRTGVAYAEGVDESGKHHSRGAHPLGSVDQKFLHGEYLVNPSYVSDKAQWLKSKERTERDPDADPETLALMAQSKHFRDSKPEKVSPKAQAKQKQALANIKRQAQFFRK